AGSSPAGGRSYLFQPPRRAAGPSGINPGFPGLFRCRGWMTHVLLTRSPLSPVPKDRFSLDLHVLSAPPAFVLSQDQTLREEWFAGRGPRDFHFELALKGRLRGGDEDVPLAARRGRPLEVSTFVNAVEFSKTGAARRRKKASDSRQRPPRTHTIVSGTKWAGAAPVVELWDLSTPPSRTADAV